MEKITGLEDTIRWYDENAETYADKNAEYFDLNHIDTFISLLPDNPSVLDAGCGPGRDANFLAERGAQVVGLDLSVGLTETAKRRVPDTDFLVGDL